MNLKQNYESGRSMTEMLGVLAVTGVLSIGGIAGYNYAMSKHHANQVLQDIRLVYQELKYPNTVRQIVSEGSFPDIELDLQSPYEYDFDFANLENFDYDSTSEKTPNLISIDVSGVSKGTCDVLLKTKPQYVLMLKVNGETVWNCTQDENVLNYIFEITTDKLEYGTCSVCTGDHCFDDKLNCPEGEYCRNDICTKCEEGYVENKQGKCAECNFNYTTNVTVDKCYLCDGTIWGDRYNSGFGEHCVKCGYGAVPTTEEECQTRCGHMDGIIYMYGRCFIGKNFTYQRYSSKEDCDKMKEYAENVVFYPMDAAGKNTTALCARCYSGTINEDETACTCPSGKFWTFLNGAHAQCRDCTEAKTAEGGNHLSSKIECDKCPNRYYNVAKGGNDRNGSCPVCPEGQVKDTSAEGDGRRCVDAS